MPNHAENPVEAECKEINGASPSHPTSSDAAQLTRIPTEEDEEDVRGRNDSVYHVYAKQDTHKCISVTEDPTRERRTGPTPKERKIEREQKKQARLSSNSSETEHEEDSFFLHKPYLAFHCPPRVLFHGNSKRAKPVVLIHEGLFWRTYKLQLGPSLARHNVLDPRGVVSWQHNGGDRKSLKADDHKLKGYRVRTWRLWGETGKEYVHSVKHNRRAGEGLDPDNIEGTPAKADDVVYLRWTNALSRHTRRYHFRYATIDFYWKGTGTVKESRSCGAMLRFSHLKLVAKVPIKEIEDNDTKVEHAEVTLCKYTSSIAKEKNGKLEFFDLAILRLAEEHMPAMLSLIEEGPHSESERIVCLKRSTLYHVIVATAMCMLISEKEKRHTLLEILEHAGEGGG